VKAEGIRSEIEGDFIDNLFAYFNKIVDFLSDLQLTIKEIK
jgi:hypothetical protein